MYCLNYEQYLFLNNYYNKLLNTIMAPLTAKLFRDYFGGSWLGRITKNGEFLREITFNWNTAFGEYSAIGIEEGSFAPYSSGIIDNTNQISVTGWRSDVKRWCATWYNQFGGYGELQWVSQEVVKNRTVLFGFIHECKQESDCLTNHVVECEIIDQNNFVYTIRSFRKGFVKIEVERVRTAEELKKFIKNQSLSN